MTDADLACRGRDSSWPRIKLLKYRGCVAVADPERKGGEAPSYRISAHPIPAFDAVVARGTAGSCWAI